MSCYLIKITEQYRCDTEEEAKRLINNAKNSNKYTLTKSSDEIKDLKSKGEIIDEWHRVMLTKVFCSEKEPDCVVNLEEEDEDE